MGGGMATRLLSAGFPLSVYNRSRDKSVVLASNGAFVATSGWQAPPLEPFLEPFSGGADIPEGV